MNNVRVWLLGLIILVFLIISVGGQTRLTRSGLSMVEWKPVTGIILPLTDEAWNAEFEKYKQTPEFKKINSHFEIEDYKDIYFWEYVHRSLGRILFLFVLLPGFYFLRQKKILLGDYLTLLVLIGFQGLVGWVMVKSGLVSEPRVSPYLLAAHYFLALTLLSYIFYLLCFFREPIEYKKDIKTQMASWTVFVLLLIQIFYGCLMSGFHAGLMSDTFPLMYGNLIPRDLFILTPMYSNFLKNPVTIHWLHRWLGITVFMAIAVFSVLGLRTARRRGPFIHLLGITVSQIILGLILIFFHVPKFVATMHQLIAALIVLGYINIIFRSRLFKRRIDNEGF